jgi:hypothetical protein
MKLYLNFTILTSTKTCFQPMGIKKNAGNSNSVRMNKEMNSDTSKITYFLDIMHRLSLIHHHHSQALIVQDGPLASLSGFLDDRHTDELSARRRDLYLHRTTQHINTTNILAPSGIRSCDPSNQAAADLRLRPRGHWV